MNCSRRIVVVGAGVVGLSTAYYCARRGHRVTVLDRHAAEHENCSYGNAGYIVPSHFVPLAAPGMVALGLRWMLRPDSPFYIKPRLDWSLWDWGWKFCRAATAEHVERSAPLLRDLNLASRACFEELAGVTGNPFGLEKRGLLCLCKTAQRLEEEARLVEKARELGLNAEVLSAKQTAALDPEVRMDIVGAVYFHDDCHLAPHQFMNALKQEIRRMGVAIRWHTEATGWRVEGRRLTAIRTTEGEVAADEFVLCGGAWSPLLLRQLGLRLPMQAGKGYSLTLPRPRRRPRVPAVLTERRVAVTPMGDSLRFGGTMELVGLDETIHLDRVEAIQQAAALYYPDFTPDDFRGVRPWAGLRPCSPDGLPYIGRFPRYENLWTGTGHAMMGLSLGPITGKLLAELLSGEQPSLDLTLVAPARYG